MRRLIAICILLGAFHSDLLAKGGKKLLKTVPPLRQHLPKHQQSLLKQSITHHPILKKVIILQDIISYPN